MRNTLTILFALATGVLLALWWASPSTAISAGAPWLNAPTDLLQSDESGRWPAQAPTPEQVLYAQPRMMREALAQLGPRVAGKPNLYLLTFAADGSEDVFHNEAEYAANLFTRRFGPGTHRLVLQNNPATLTTSPLANWSNLETALAGLHQVMQPDQDILLLYVTTHGSEDHELLVDMDPLPLDQLGASDLAGILALHPFKWKVLVINACYSGGFVPPLQGPGTLILTSARADRTSFGCGSDSDITYFGKAWLVDALNHTDRFVDAFRQASAEIAAWEKRDQLTPSEPQIDIGAGITAQLDLWRKGITPGPVVPFMPSSPSPTSPATTR